MSPIPSRKGLAARLASIAGKSAALEAKWLIEKADGDAERLEAMVARRLAREPLDRIFGHRGFWTLDLFVTPAVLSPRPDSETIVEAARDHIRPLAQAKPGLRILDLGTGSGALLLALLDVFSDATGLGIDISPDAIAIADLNAQHNGASSRAAFRQGNWGNGLQESGLHQNFDLVVSNPPYIRSGDIGGLDPEVCQHDPHLALDGGADGLAAYRAICAELPALLTANGIAVLEVGAGQAPDVRAIGEAHGLVHRETRRDLGGIERAMVFGR